MTAYSYNGGRNTVQVVANPEGKGWVLEAANVAKGATMVVSLPILSREQAEARARVWAGIRPQVDPDAVEGWLSERLGF